MAGRRAHTFAEDTCLVPFKGLFDELFAAGVRGGQNALIVSSLTDLVSKDLQDPWSCYLIGQLRRVVRSQSLYREHCQGELTTKR